MYKYLFLCFSFWLLAGCQDVSFELTEEKLSSLGVGGVGLVIEDGAEYTRKSVVEVFLVASNADEFYLTEDSDCESGGEWEPFVESKNHKLKVSNGKNDLFVKYRNEGGFSSECVRASVVHDDIPPVVKYTGGPSHLANKREFELTYSSVDHGSGVGSESCWVGAKADEFSCNGNRSSGKGRTDGEYEHKLQVVDRAGNRSEIKIYKWKIDSTAPTVTLLKSPPWVTSSSSASFELNTDKDPNGAVTILCGIDKNSLEECDKSRKFENLKEGEKRFYYQALDVAGNFSDVSRYVWTVDQSPPKITWVKKPELVTNRRKAKFKYSATDQWTAVEYLCHKPNSTEGFIKCNDELELEAELKEGENIFLVKAVDQAGNSSPALTYKWVVDSVAPEIKWHKVPLDVDSKESNLISFDVSDLGVGLRSVECHLDGIPWSCGKTTVKTLPPQVIGEHRLEILAQDEIGNKSRWEKRWQVFQAVKHHEQTLEIEHRGLVDVLFVVDNSMSMSAEQSKMAKRFDHFLKYIDDLSWQIGITTTDPNDSASAGDGKLLSFSQGVKILDSHVEFRRAEELFAKTIQRSEWGSAQERGIHGAYRAIERAMNGEANHKKLFRNKSHLAVVIISDEDESGRDVSDSPDEFIKLVKRFGGEGKDLSVHSVIVRPGDVQCLIDDQAYGYAYAELTAKTGGILGDICADDYAKQLGSMGEEIRNRLKVVQLNCTPIDKDGDGSLDVKVRWGENVDPVNYYLNGDLLIFDEPIPLGRHKVIYSCEDK